MPAARHLLQEGLERRVEARTAGLPVSNDDKRCWNRIEDYIFRTHRGGLQPRDLPECAKKLYGKYVK